MCSPIGHLLFAKQIKDKYFPNVDELAYYSGTLFPDIRYYVGIPKASTHDLTKKISEIKDVSDWYKGLWVHSILDRVHELYMVSTDTKALSPHSRYVAYTLLEDQLFYSDIEGLVDIPSYVSSTFKEENNFGVDTVKIKEFKEILGKYISKKPTYEDQASFLVITVPDLHNEVFMEELRQNILDITNEKVINDIKRFKDEFLGELVMLGSY